MILLRSAVKVLHRDYGIPKETWSQEMLTAIEQDLLVKINPHSRTLPQWLTCWKSTGGSVGMELYRLSLRKLVASIESNVQTTNIAKTILIDFDLAKPVQLGCPKYKPAQVEGQNSPVQPTPNIVRTIPTVYQSWFSDIFKWLIGLGIIGVILWRRTTNPFQDPYNTIWWRIATPVLLFLGLELGVGLFTTPLLYTTPLFQSQGWQVVPWTVDEDSQHFWTQGSYLRAQKIPRTTSHPRVVILGASSAHGSNELWEDTFAGRLQSQGTWDVVNLGIGGTTSTGLVSILPYVEQLNPDALIIYYGHNEVHQLRQLSNIRPTFIQWYPVQRLLWSSNLYTLLHTWITLSKDPNLDIQKMEETPTKSALTEDQLLSFSKAHFENNLNLVLHSTQTIPTLLITPPTNYPFAPMEYSESLPETITDIQKQIDAHPESTTIHSTIKSIIPTLAKKHGTYHWDLDVYFHQNSPDTTSANGLFWDELHPSALGHKWIADGLKTWLSKIEPSNTDR